MLGLWFAIAPAHGRPAGPDDPDRVHLEDLPAEVRQQLEQLPPNLPMTPTEADALDPGAYMDRLEGEQYHAIDEIGRRLMRMAVGQSDARACDAELAAMRDVARHAAVVARLAPAYHGDAAMRDAVAARYDAIAAQLERSRAEVMPLLMVVPATDDTAARLETVFRAQLAAEIARAADFHAGLARFAEGHRVHLISDEKSPPVWPDFTAPGIPPEGSAMPGTYWVILASHYQVAAVGLHNRMQAALQTFVTALSEPSAGHTSEETRKTVLRELEDLGDQADQLGGWQGDRSVQTTLAAEVHELATFLDGADGATLTRFAERKSKTNEVATYNAAVQGLNEGVAARTAAFGSAKAAFEARWQFAEFTASAGARQQALEQILDQMEADERARHTAAATSP